MAFFHFVASELITATDHYELPTVIADINTSGMQADEPVYYKYLKGVNFGLWTGTENHQAVNATAAACYPNPFTGSAKVDVTIDKPATVTLSVFDITGQKLSSTNYGTMASGKHSLTIDGTNLRSGVYFYTITIGDQKFNNKMIVK